MPLMGETKHWTHELFIEDSNLYLPELEKRARWVEKDSENIINLLKDHGVTEGRILDVPCGIGTYSFHFNRLGFNVTGLDLSPSFIELAKEKARARNLEDNCTFIVGDMRKIGDLLHGEQCDAATLMFHSLGYYDYETDRRVLTQLRKLVRENGLLVVDMFDRDWLVRNFFPYDMWDRDDGVRVIEVRSFDPETSRQHSKYSYYQVESENLVHLKTIEVDFRLYSLHETSSCSTNQDGHIPHPTVNLIKPSTHGKLGEP